ncbi:MAG: hypothetical protein GY950_29850 [bacterium]|nr:hypothetical protein [bacterium]
MKNIFLLVLLLLFFVNISAQVHIQPPGIKKKVEELLARMTVEEKIGQMTQVALETISIPNPGNKKKQEIDIKKLKAAIKKYHVGSILNVYGGAYSIGHWHMIITAIQDVAVKETGLKIPVLCGIDSIHGANYITGTTIFPQSIGMAATFNPGLSKIEGEVTAYETRASGIPWNFNPVLGLGRSPVWPRHWETYGEDPYLAGVDMSMVPDDYSFYEHLLELVKEGEVPMSRIDEAVKRILMVKFKLELFKNPYPDKTLAEKVGCKEFTQAALDAARESITLLKNNNNILPLSKGKRVLVTGPNADGLSVLNGGWTYTWQGNDESYYPEEKDTILEAVEKKFGQAQVTYVPGCEFDKEIDIEAAVKKAKDADVIIACLGENAYCETPGIIDDLSLPRVQLELVSRLHKTGKPIVLVLTEGRPRLIRDIVDKVAGIVTAYLPGNEGGRAIAEVLAGDVNPSGKLPFTFPKYPNDLVCYDHKYSENTEPNKFDPQFPFGFGLSYTVFRYGDLVLDKEVVKGDETLAVTVNLRNTGKRQGKEVVLLYVSDLYASVTPSVKRLKRFKKIELAPGEAKKVTFTLTREDLSFIGLDMKPVVEPGEFKITVGPLTKNFKLL